MHRFQISNHLTFMYHNVEISFYDAVAKIILRETWNGVKMGGVNPNAADMSGSCLFSFADDTYMENTWQP